MWSVGSSKNFYLNMYIVCDFGFLLERMCQLILTQYKYFRTALSKPTTSDLKDRSWTFHISIGDKIFIE